MADKENKANKAANNKVKAIVAAVAIALCAAVIVLVCVFVLVPNKADDSHIKIEDADPGNTEINYGTLNVSLIRERLDTVVLNETGFLTPHTNTTHVDFSSSRDNIFGIGSNLIVGPGCRFSAQMAISNLDRADFEYWLEIVPENGENLLANQLELTVAVGENEVVKRILSDGLTTAPLATVRGSDTSRFTATLEYLDVTDNDQTQNASLAFDVVVHVKLVSNKSKEAYQWQN